jgi:DNA-binding winged helix-turn-helix (wHTH) protein/TolB-like protein/Tfp pilus assembly protein PilF
MTASRFSYQFGAFRLDPVEKVLLNGDVPAPLTPKTVETLLALVERHGHVVTKDELLRAVWPDTVVEENNLAQHISMLRRVLVETAGNGQLIETIPKRGYRFVGPVEKRIYADDESMAAELTAELAGAAITSTAGRDGLRAATARRRMRPAALWIVVAIALLAFVSVGIDSWMSGRKPTGAAALGVTGVTRMAVLPFVNLGSSDDEYFVAGMTEELISRLAGLRNLAVSSSTTVTSYDRRGKSVRQIGADLGVEYVVEGSVRWARHDVGTQVRITPKLIRVADDTAVWTQRYDASLSDLFGVQGEIAYRIAGALQVALEGREHRVVDTHPTSDTDAYLAYLRGITSFQQGWADTSNQSQAREELERAVARDARFAMAWSWLARVYAWQYNTGANRSPETKQLARRAAQTAMALDPGLPEGHLGLAQVLLIDRDYEPALRELKIARDGLPNSPELLRLIGWVEQRKGRWDDSLRTYMRAFDIDPVSTAEVIAVHYNHQRQYDEARRFIAISKAGNRAAIVPPDAWTRFSESGDIASARRVLEPALGARAPADARVRGLLSRLEWFDGRHQRALDLIDGMDGAGAWLPPNFRFPASLAAAQVYESMGRLPEAAKRYSEALAALVERHRSAPDDYQIEAALGLAAAGLGRGDEALRHGERAVQLQPVTRDAAEGPLYLYLLAQIHSRLRQPAAAFAVLDRMFSVPGFYNEICIQRDPGFRTLRDDPSFRAHLDRWSAQRGEALLAKLRRE